MCQLLCDYSGILPAFIIILPKLLCSATAVNLQETVKADQLTVTTRFNERYI